MVAMVLEQVHSWKVGDYAYDIFLERIECLPQPRG